MSVNTVSDVTFDPATSVNDPQQILLDALFIVKNKHGHNVQYLGQHKRAEGAPFDITNLCELALTSGKRIGDVNVVKWKEGVYNHEKKERIIERFYTSQELAEIINRMVEEHLTPQEEGILVTASGTRFSIKNLTHSLEIDEMGFFRVDGLRLWTMVWKGQEEPLLAAKLRSNTLLELKEFEGRIEIKDEDDPAPAFFIDLMKPFKPEGSNESFYLLCREWQK